MTDVMLPYNLEPTIVIACDVAPVSGGKLGDYRLQPRVAHTNVPGASRFEQWKTVHALLCQSLHIAAQEMVKEAHAAQGQVMVPLFVPPGPLGRD